jgi:hypothetical protein
VRGSSILRTTVELPDGLVRQLKARVALGPAASTFRHRQIESARGLHIYTSIFRVAVGAEISRIKQFVEAYNKNTAPFIWTATADSILEQLQKLCSRISGTV